MATKKPIRMWIDGKCYSEMYYKDMKKIYKKYLQQGTLPGYTDENIIKFDVSATDSGKFTTSFHLPSIYYTKLNTLPDFNLKQFESDSKTEVIFPKNGDDGNMTINGDREQIINARSMIHCMIGSLRERLMAAQFIGIPLQSESIKCNFEKFKNDILTGERIIGMDETIFQKAVKLHLTLGVFALMDEIEKAEAISALHDCKTEVVTPILSNVGPATIKVCGINCMNPDVKRVNVLYADAKILNAQGVNILQHIADGISDYFYERGLLTQYQESIKLHVTLINTKYRSYNPSSPKKMRKWNFKRQPFDASSIMEKYKDYYFGESPLESIHLSYITSIGEDGFYEPLSVINL